MRDIDFFQCFGSLGLLLSSVLRTTKESGSRCSGPTGEMSGEMVEMEAVLPGDTVDTSSESGEREMVRNIFGFTLVATILIYANLQVLGRQLVGLVLIWKTGDARHNARPRVTLGSTLWELPPLDGAWESDGRRVKTRILGPNVKGRLNRRNKRGSRREKRLNMPGIRLTEAS